MEQRQKDYIYNLIYDNRFSILNNKNKEERFKEFLKKK